MDGGLTVSRGSMFRGSRMVANGCTKPHRLGTCYEHIQVGKKRYCLFCLIEKIGNRPWFYTGSPHGGSLGAAGVPPIGQLGGRS